jgi:hypothetical protein
MDVFGSRLRAQEGAFFKSEAERDIERLAARRRARNADGAETLLASGDDDEKDARGRPSSSASGNDYAKAGSAARGGVDKLGSVYAEELRLPGTTTNARATHLRRTVGRGDETKRDGLRRAAGDGRDSIFAAQTLGSKLNRRDWMREVSADLRRAAAERKALSPMEIKALETSQMAQRHAMVGGLRALAYGTGLAFVGVVGGSVAASSLFQIDSHGDFERKFRATFEPHVQAARASAEPYKRWIDADGGEGVASRVSLLENSAMVSRLRAKLGRRKDDGHSGPF